VLETDTGFAKGYGSKIKGESAFSEVYFKLPQLEFTTF
jgi:hypothetical protein